MRLLDLYRYMHSRIHSTSRPLKLIYHVAEKETLLAWVGNVRLMLFIQTQRNLKKTTTNVLERTVSTCSPFIFCSFRSSFVSNSC